MLIREIGNALKGPKKEKTTLKELMSNIDTQELAQAAKTDSGGMHGIGSEPYFPKERIDIPLKAQSEFGTNYAPSTGLGTPQQQETGRKNYEQNAFGLDGLRESFMKEGMTPSIDVGLPSFQGFNIDALIFQEQIRNKNSRPPGNMGWR